MSRAKSRLRSAAALAVACLVLTASALAGCTDQTAEANALIDKANVRIAEYNKLDAEMGELMQKAGEVDPSEEGAAEALGYLDSIDAGLKRREAAATAARAELSAIAGLKISEDYAAYAKQRAEIVALMLKADSRIGELVENMRQMFKLVASGTPDEAELQRLSDAGDAIDKAIQALDNEIAAKEEASDRFFKDKGLGR